MTVTTDAIRTAAATLTDLPLLSDSQIRIAAAVVTDRYSLADLEAAQTDLACTLHCQGLDLIALAEKVQQMSPAELLPLLDIPC